MKSLPVRRGSTNGNSCGDGRNSSVETQGMGALLGRLNGGMNYPTILPSFVCSYSSKTPPPHSQQCQSSPEQHPPNHPTEHTETLTKLYQLMGQHSKPAHVHTFSISGKISASIQELVMFFSSLAIQFFSKQNYGAETGGSCYHRVSCLKLGHTYFKKDRMTVVSLYNPFYRRSRKGMGFCVKVYCLTTETSLDDQSHKLNHQTQFFINSDNP